MTVWHVLDGPESIPASIPDMQYILVRLHYGDPSEPDYDMCTAHFVRREYCPAFTHWAEFQTLESLEKQTEPAAPAIPMGAYEFAIRESILVEQKYIETTYYVTTGELQVEIEATSSDEAAEMAIKHTNPNMKLGLLTRVSVHNFTGECSDDMFYNTQSLAEKLGFTTTRVDTIDNIERL